MIHRPRKSLVKPPQFCYDFDFCSSFQLQPNGGSRTINVKRIDHYEYLKLTGEYGRFQKIINFIFCVSIFPSMFPLLIMFFSFNTPSWRCKPNSLICVSNWTYDATNESRCAISRNEWEYTKSAEYSLVTQFNIDCENKWIGELLHSILFFGFIFGAVIIGWLSDNYGRKIVHYISMSVVMTLGFICIFSPNMYFFILCRFLIGICMHGTFPQIFVMISEIVGNEKRVFANTLIIASAVLALSFLALKAYFLTEWKHLYIACSLPYSFVILFSLFVPQSIRFLSVKGRHREAVNVFARIAKWNRRTVPNHYLLATTGTSDTSAQQCKSSPFDLFRTRAMLSRSLIQGYAFFVLSMTYYSLYLAAGNLSGHMYRDFAFITILDLPVLLFTNYALDRFGRKKSACALVFLGSTACIMLGFIIDQYRFKVLKVVLAVVGKCCTGGIIATLNIWSIELYPTNIRVQGLAFLQVMDKIGSTISIWIVNELSVVHKGLPFFLIGTLSIVTFFLIRYLPEMKGKTISDDISEAIRDDNSVQTEERITNGPTNGGWNLVKCCKRQVEPL